MNNIWSNIKWFFSNLIKGLFNDKDGFSMRKCIAVIVVKASLALEFMFCEKDILTDVLWINFGFAALLLGIVTVGNLIELKSGKKEKLSNEANNT